MVGSQVLIVRAGSGQGRGEAASRRGPAVAAEVEADPGVTVEER